MTGKPQSYLKHVSCTCAKIIKSEYSVHLHKTYGKTENSPSALVYQALGKHIDQLQQAMYFLTKFKADVKGQTLTGLLACCKLSIKQSCACL